MTTVPEEVQKAYGSLPTGWRLEKLKFFSEVRNSNVDKTIVDDEEPVWLCNYTDVYYNDRITPDIEFMQGSATEAEIEKFRLKRGQVIITKDSEGWNDIGIPALVTEDMPDVLCGYHLSVFEPGTELDGGFLAWLCRSEPLNDQFKTAANGVTRFGLGQYPMKNAFVALPPLETQRRIARFLDEKTARIDGLIEKKRALLDRLAEKRQALITRAVTKGLTNLPGANLNAATGGGPKGEGMDSPSSPAAPMKPSGIDWLGDIPAHWGKRRLRFDAHLNPLKSKLALPADTEVSFVPMDAVGEHGGLQLNETRPIGEIYNGYTYFADGDICIAKITPCFENGKGALARGLTNGVAFGTTELHVIRPLPGLDAHFLFYMTIAHDFRSFGEAEMLGAGGQKRVPEEFLKDWRAPLPPPEIQRKIVQFLDEATAQIRAQSERIERSIDPAKRIPLHTHHRRRHRKARLGGHLMSGHTELDFEIAIEADLTGDAWVATMAPEVVS